MRWSNSKSFQVLPRPLKVPLPWYTCVLPVLKVSAYQLVYLFCKSSNMHTNIVCKSVIICKSVISCTLLSSETDAGTLTMNKAFSFMPTKHVVCIILHSSCHPDSQINQYSNWWLVYCQWRCYFSLSCPSHWSAYTNMARCVCFGSLSSVRVNQRQSRYFPPSPINIQLYTTTTHYLQQYWVILPDAGALIKTN